jgi:membrane-associated phospholipid phosphatase
LFLPGIRGFVAGTLDSMKSGVKRPLRLAAACWVAFGAVLVAAYWIPFTRWADGWAVDGFIHVHNQRLNDIANVVAKLANPVPYAVWTVALAAIALYRRRPRHALAVILLVGCANLLTQGLKVLLEHPRYHDFLGHAQLGASAFPSGHATASMALAFAAVLLAPQAWRPLVAVGGALFALGVSESVMLLAWHFPSDVAGGFLVATSSALVTLAALRAAGERWPERTGRKAAKRALGAADPYAAAAIVAAFVVALLAGVTVAAGERTLEFADRHTLAVLAAVAVAAMAAALPASVAALGARRS